MLDFQGKTALITGAGGGISGACAEILHAAGANVVLTDVQRHAVDALAARLDSAGTSVLALRHDVASADDADAAVSAAVSKFGGIDIVIPGAGLYLDQPLSTMSDHQWRKVLGINLDGVFYTIRAAAPQIRDGGAVVAIASMAGHKGSLNHGHYAASKGGVLTLARTFALELAPRVRVNAVSPGLIETPMIDQLMAANGNALIQQTPLKRLGTAREVADAVVYLCSDQASFITGETLHVNGGIYIAS